MSVFRVIGSRGRSPRATSAPLVTPASASRRPCRLPAASSRSIMALSLRCWSPARWSSGIDSAPGSNIAGARCAVMCAALPLTRLKIGLMTTVPDRSRVRLPGISSRAYEHPADRSALVAMRKLTGFDVLLRRLAGLFNDRSLRLLFLASAVRASTVQFPELYALLLDGAAILDLPVVPELYVTQDPQPNAMTLGSDKPFIVITTGLVDLLDAE